MAGYAFECLTTCGVEVTPAESTFYLFPNFECCRKKLAENGVKTGQEFCDLLFDEQKVAVSQKFGKCKTRKCGKFKNPKMREIKNPNMQFKKQKMRKIYHFKIPDILNNGKFKVAQIHSDKIYNFSNN